jgi:hypothetical protein
MLNKSNLHSAGSNLSVFISFRMLIAPGQYSSVDCVENRNFTGSMVSRFYNIIFSLILLGFFAEAEAAVNAPEVKCVSVLNNGDVTLTWEVPADPLGEFVSYDVYFSASLAGPFTLASSISNYPTDTYTHSGAGANTAPRFFFVQTVSTGGVISQALDTVKSIFLNVTNPFNGTAQLSWNAFGQPLPSTSTGSYDIYREYPAGTWTLIKSITSLSAKDTIDVCNAVLNYRIEIRDASGCISVSNIDGDSFIDGIPPNRPILDSVSINSAGQAVIGLLPSSSGDAIAYVIYQHIGASVIAIDTVPGNSPVLYINSASIANGTVETYDIASIDSCGNVCTHSLAQNTLFVAGQYSICGRSVFLQWNQYRNMVGGLKEYQVLVSLNGGPYSLVGSTGDLFYRHNNLVAGSTYCYLIRAVNNTGDVSSTSNNVCFLAKAQTQPSYIYVSAVSVISSSSIEVRVGVDTASTVKGINIYRSDSATGVFSFIGMISAGAAPTYIFTDSDVEPGNKSYYYYAEVVDSCGLPGISSNTSKSILLRAVANHGQYTNTLNWDDYSVYLGNVASYNIFRAVDGTFSPSPVANVAGNVLSYQDDVSDFVPNQGKFSYYVQAVEGAGNPYGFAELSNSNIVDVYHGDSIFIPNAFAPRGLNKVFLPITQYVEKTDYKVSIFNRFGQQIWATESDTEGWDGNGCQEGIYIYVVELKNAYGEYKEYRGTVMLIK